MKIRPHDQFGGHEGGPHLRYVQQYATSENEKSVASATGAGPIEVTSTGHGYSTGDEVTITGGDAEVNGTWIITSTGANTFTLNGSTGDGTYTSAGTIQYAQPVKVKLLKWDGSAFVTYGTEFRIGDTDTADEVSSGEKFWVVWRRDAQRWYPISGGNEKFRLIRGQSVGAQSGATVLIDNVDVLAGGLDPTDGNPATQVTVQNIWGQTYADNEKVQAVYNEGLGGTILTDWENFKTTAGTEQYRLIRGLVKGAVTAAAATFVIDNVVPLGSGNDPVSGNAATEITVSNTHRALSGTAGETLRDNTPVTAIWTGAIWELLLVERYRLIKGKATAESSAGAGTFSIDEVDVLAGSVDPRTDPTSEIETVTVTKTWPDKYKNNADIIAAHNPRTGAWDVISRGLTMEGLTINLDIVAGPPKKLRVELLLDGEVISFDEVTFSTKIINNPIAASLNLDADSLDLDIDYTPVTFYELVAPEDGVSDDFTDTVVVDDCTP